MDLSDCGSKEHVHNKLLVHICTEYLDNTKCPRNFEKFRIQCNLYLETPAEMNQSKAFDFCGELSKKGLLKPGKYNVLRNVTDGIHHQIGELIHEAEEKIKILMAIHGKQQTDRKISSSKKRQFSREISMNEVQGPSLEVVCRVKIQRTISFNEDFMTKTYISDRSNQSQCERPFISHEDSIAESFLRMIMQDYDGLLQTYSNLTDLSDSLRNLENITYKLIQIYIDMYSHQGDRSMRHGKQLVLLYLKMLRKEFYCGKEKFQKFCDESSENIFRNLMSSAKAYENFLSMCDGSIGGTKVKCVICYHVFHTVNGLDIFWKYYKYGELGRFLEDLLNVDSILSLIGADQVQITVNISEESYLQYRKLLEQRETVSIKEIAIVEFQTENLCSKNEQSMRQTSLGIAPPNVSTEDEIESMDDKLPYEHLTSLVFLQCPILLRTVISDSYTLRGIPNFESFLDRNKHNFFHLVNAKCTCGNFSNFTPISAKRFSLLFTQESQCQEEPSESPCQYSPIKGISLCVMDVDLCCCVIEHICPGYELDEIHSILKVVEKLLEKKRNELQDEYIKEAMDRIRTAMLKLALGLSPQRHSQVENTKATMICRDMDRKECTDLQMVKKLLNKRIYFQNSINPPAFREMPLDLKPSIIHRGSYKDELGNGEDAIIRAGMVRRTISFDPSCKEQEIVNLREYCAEPSCIVQKMDNLKEKSDHSGIDYNLKRLRKKQKKQKRHGCVLI